jgi:DNA-binding transcriptional regulator YiaG
MDKDEIRQLRKSLGMTQQTFSNKLGISTSTVQKWEGGTAKPRGLSRKVLKKLARKVSKQ